MTHDDPADADFAAAYLRRVGKAPADAAAETATFSGDSEGRPTTGPRERIYGGLVEISKNPPAPATRTDVKRV